MIFLSENNKKYYLCFYKHFDILSLQSYIPERGAWWLECFFVFFHFFFLYLETRSHIHVHAHKHIQIYTNKPPNIIYNMTMMHYVKLHVLAAVQ